MGKSSVLLSHPTGQLQGTVSLPASKSESNRLLIIQALARESGKVSNLSSARDTQTLLSILQQTSTVWDVKDAGTTMRFLTAYAAIKGLEVEITGTQRMQQRPIGILVEALQKLGASIQYKSKAGYPPLQIGPFQYSGTNQLEVNGSVSSQFISALCMIAPLLPQGLKLMLKGTPSSVPYIDLTLESIRRSGISASRIGSEINISPGKYTFKPVAVEPDWSSAGYWFSMAVLSRQANLALPGLLANSLQADSAVLQFLKKLEFEGVSVKPGEITLTKNTGDKIVTKQLLFDFSHCPDLAQTAIVMLSALNVSFKITGLQSLKVKETDRIAALQQELKPFGINLVEISEDCFENQGMFRFPNETPTINTYEDHRMAMAFAPLALISKIKINEPDVVEKSYPEFWEHLQSLGFRVDQRT